MARRCSLRATFSHRSARAIGAVVSVRQRIDHGSRQAAGEMVTGSHEIVAAKREY
jgi:hypothetical protein